MFVPSSEDASAQAPVPERASAQAPAREDEDASAEAPCIAQLRAALVLMADTLLAGEPAARGRDRYVRARIAAVLVRFRQWRCGA